LSLYWASVLRWLYYFLLGLPQINNDDSRQTKNMVVKESEYNAATGWLAG